MTTPTTVRECTHPRTHMVLNPMEPHIGPSIEVCDDCRMSRSHWEQGSSPWMLIGLCDNCDEPFDGRADQASGIRLCEACKLDPKGRWAKRSSPPVPADACQQHIAEAEMRTWPAWKQEIARRLFVPETREASPPAPVAPIAEGELGEMKAASIGCIGADRAAMGLLMVPDAERGDMDAVCSLRQQLAAANARAEEAERERARLAQELTLEHSARVKAEYESQTATAQLKRNQDKYPLVLEAAREAARQCGYAIGLHGSEARDLDLIAVPWRELALDPDLLVHKIAEAVGGIHDPKTDMVKPFGRLSRVIRVAGSYIDLSIAPLADLADARQQVAGMEGMRKPLECLISLAENNKRAITGEAKGDPNYWRSFQSWIDKGRAALAAPAPTHEAGGEGHKLHGAIDKLPKDTDGDPIIPLVTRVWGLCEVGDSEMGPTPTEYVECVISGRCKGKWMMGGTGKWDWLEVHFDEPAAGWSKSRERAEQAEKEYSQKADEYIDDLINTTKGKRCSACHAPCEFGDGSWRFNGKDWEHQCPGVHPQAGYFPAEPLPPAPGEAGGEVRRSD